MRRAEGGTHAHGIGRSRGGPTTKIHAAVEALGLPVRLIPTAGQRGDGATVPGPPRPGQGMIHLGVQRPLGQRLLQPVEQAAGVKRGRRIGARQKLVEQRVGYAGVVSVRASGDLLRSHYARPNTEFRTAPAPCRWVVERTFAWLTRWRRLVRDYEARIDVFEAMTPSLWQASSSGGSAIETVLKRTLSPRRGRGGSRVGESPTLRNGLHA